MSFFSRILCAGALAGVAVLAAGRAQAKPDYHRAGTVCRPNNGDLAKITYTDNQGVVNTSTSSSATVYCPVDSFLDPHGVIISRSVRVMVIDRSGSEAVSCTLKHFASDGTVVQTIGPLATSTTGKSSTAQALTFTITNDGQFRGYLNLFCTLPKGVDASSRSHVVSYKLVTQ
jgi:hypothetical protein